MYFGILNECRELYQSFHEARLLHIDRDRNKLADALARKGRNASLDVNVTRYLAIPPSYCLNLVLSDCNRRNAET